MTRLNFTLIGLIVSGACSSPPADTVRIAKEVEPIIKRLRDPGQEVLQRLGGNEGAMKAVVTACSSADEPLTQLSRIDFRPVTGDPLGPEVNELAGRLLDDRKAYCAVDDLGGCARWCVVSWTALVVGTERLRARALTQGVAIGSIVQ